MFRCGLPIFVAASLLGVLTWQPSIASPVYPGCASPAPVSRGQSHFVDPIHGSMSGDGSRAHPWRTLQEVVAAGAFSTSPPKPARGLARFMPGRPSGTIRPGDMVWLLNGDHGVVKLQGYFGRDLVGYANSDFITIAAAPGQTPILHSLTVLGGSKWVFRGLTIRSLNDTGQFLAGGTVGQDYYLVSLRGPHSDIVIDGNHLQSAADVRKWTNDDWMRKRASGIFDDGGKCIAVTNNSFQNIGAGLKTASSDRVVIANNTIDHFSDDGIDYGSNDLLIEHNTITNSIEDGDGIHRDAMQGQPGKPYRQETVTENITIKDNVIIRVTDPTLVHPGFLQGIDAFDGVWKNVDVSGNTVIVDAWHGISFYGVHDARITNNIVLGDGGRVLPCGNVSFAVCATKATAIDKTTFPSIIVNHSKLNQPSTGVLVEGNITTGVRIDPKSPTVTVRNNLCVMTKDKCPIGMPIDGRMQWVGAQGTYGDRNIVPAFGAGGLFVAYDPVKLKYDLKLKRRNPASPK